MSDKDMRLKFAERLRQYEEVKHLPFKIYEHPNTVKAVFRQMDKSLVGYGHEYRLGIGCQLSYAESMAETIVFGDLAFVFIGISISGWPIEKLMHLEERFAPGEMGRQFFEAAEALPECFPI